MPAQRGGVPLNKSNGHFMSDIRIASQVKYLLFVPPSCNIGTDGRIISSQVSPRNWAGPVALGRLFFTLPSPWIPRG
jgi:hypothetical protein